jgi:hypothetical protein
MDRRAGGLAIAAALVAALALPWAAQWAESCGLPYTLRAWLKPAFWQPLPLLHEDLRAHRAGPEPKTAFAGLGPGVAPPAVVRVRDLYLRTQVLRGRRGDGADAGRVPPADTELATALAAAREDHASSAFGDELALVDLKIGLYQAEEVGADDEMRRVRDGLRAFVERTRDPALASEARGWLARTHYLLGDRPAAARLYLDEAENPASVLDSGTLANSLSMLYPYNGSDAGLADDLPRFLDTPRHALYAARLLTNPIFESEADNAARSAVSRRVAETIAGHVDLFGKGADSDALALVLMRAALHGGDPQGALRFGERVSATPPATLVNERAWMTAVALVLTGRPREAAPHLRAITTSPSATDRERGSAWHALVGVCQRLDDGPGQVMAAVHLAASEAAGWPSTWWRPVPWPVGGVVMDLPYLVDIAATERDLRVARRRLAAEREPIALRQDWTWPRPGPVRAGTVLDYALAVRAARRGDFGTAARLYDRVGAGTRAARMREAGALHAAAVAAGASPEARLAWAKYMASHPERLFFNDRLWLGHQRYMLLQRDDCEPTETWCSDQTLAPLLEPGMRARLEARERAFKDAQDERWQAYLFARRVVDDRSAPPAVARDAAMLAIGCLDRINDDRFGRGAEIAAARRSLLRSLRRTE